MMKKVSVVILNWNGMESIGISKGKKMLNELHERMAIEGYTEFYAETNGDIVSLTRRNPKTNRRNAGGTR